MAWNLSDYEDVATLNRWWQDNFPTGRIQVWQEYFNATEQEIVVRCDLYRDYKDEKPAVSNLARGKATDYPKNMARWYVEDTTTSAIGRAILLIKGANKTATQDSMRQVAEGDPGHKVKHPFKPAEAVKEVPNEPVTIVWDEVESTAATDPGWDPGHVLKALGAKIQSFDCKHGAMLLKEGTSKTGKPYHGYVCVAKSKADQCEPKWAKQGGNGEWVFEQKAADAW